MQLSKNFSLQELTYSATAEREGISNEPNEEQLSNLQDLVDFCLQKIRDFYGKPVLTHSAFRGEELNSLVGGVATSQHCKGQAADFSIKGEDLYSVALWCELNLVYDQLILERKGDRRWIHISFDKNKNRMESLTFIDGTYTKGLTDVG